MTRVVFGGEATAANEVGGKEPIFAEERTRIVFSELMAFVIAINAREPLPPLVEGGGG